MGKYVLIVNVILVSVPKMNKYYNDYNPNTDCSCFLEVEHKYIKNDNAVGMIGYYQVEKVIRYQDKNCREHV